jgi:hypothetical protein
MKAAKILFLATAALAAVMTVPAEAAGPAKKFKCWTNADGVRECGETVPPEFAQEGHEVLNKKGDVVSEKDRAKTPEELEEAARLAALEKEKKEKEKEAKRQDAILLETFTKVEDIERVRDDQVQALEATIKVTKARNDKIKGDLDKRVASAAAEERAGKTPNEALLKDIESLKRQMANNDAFVEKKLKEQDEIRADYDQRIARFKELKAAGR